MAQHQQQQQQQQQKQDQQQQQQQPAIMLSSGFTQDPVEVHVPRPGSFSSIASSRRSSGATSEGDSPVRLSNVTVVTAAAGHDARVLNWAKDAAQQVVDRIVSDTGASAHRGAQERSSWDSTSNRLPAGGSPQQRGVLTLGGMQVGSSSEMDLWGDGALAAACAKSLSMDTPVCTLPSSLPTTSAGMLSAQSLHPAARQLNDGLVNQLLMQAAYSDKLATSLPAERYGASNFCWSQPRLASLNLGPGSGEHLSQVDLQGGAGAADGKLPARTQALLDAMNSTVNPAATLSQGFSLEPSRHLWLGNLKTRLAASVVKTVFETFGMVEDVVTFPGRMYAFVNFLTADDAVIAAAALQDRQVPALTGNKRLVIQFRPSRKALGTSWTEQAAGQMDQTVSAPASKTEVSTSSWCSEALPDQNQLAATTSDPSHIGTGRVVPAGTNSGPRTMGRLQLPGDFPGSNLHTLADCSALQRELARQLADQECDATSGKEPGMGTTSEECGSEGDQDSNSSAVANELLGSKPCRHLWLGNIPLRPCKAAMVLLFSTFGPLESVRTFPGKTYAFVNFVDQADALCAKTMLDGQLAPAITGHKPLVIRFQKDTSKLPAGSTSAQDTGSASAGSRSEVAADQDAMSTSPQMALAGLQAVADLGRLLGDTGPREPSVNLSNLLNPNNVFYDQELASKYKKMNRVEKETLWSEKHTDQPPLPPSVMIGMPSSHIMTMLESAQQPSAMMPGMVPVQDLQSGRMMAVLDSHQSPALMPAMQSMGYDSAQMAMRSRPVSYDMAGSTNPVLYSTTMDGLQALQLQGDNRPIVLLQQLPQGQLGLATEATGWQAQQRGAGMQQVMQQGHAQRVQGQAATFARSNMGGNMQVFHQGSQNAMGGPSLVSATLMLQPHQQQQQMVQSYQQQQQMLQPYQQQQQQVLQSYQQQQQQMVQPYQQQVLQHQQVQYGNRVVHQASSGLARQQQQMQHSGQSVGRQNWSDQVLLLLP